MTYTPRKTRRRRKASIPSSARGLSNASSSAPQYCGAEQILAGFVRDGDTVVIDAAPGGEGVTLTTEASPGEAAVTNGTVMAEGGEA